MTSAAGGFRLSLIFDRRRSAGCSGGGRLIADTSFVNGNRERAKGAQLYFCCYPRVPRKPWDNGIVAEGG